jgi:hypothetical protein
MWEGKESFGFYFRYIIIRGVEILKCSTCPRASNKKKKIKTKYDDATKTKYVAGLMDKAIAKVNQNELD